METRIPSKMLEGRRVRLVHLRGSTPSVVPGSEGTVATVVGATVVVKFDSGTTLALEWASGDRWTVLPRAA